MAKIHSIIPPLTPQEIDRFWAKVNIATPDSCWCWQANTIPGGYGRFKMRKITYNAHRIAYFLHYGHDPAHHFICHRCDNRICCNPSHLYEGDHTQNMRDRNTRDRLAHSERHGRAKLTAAQVIEIRQRYADGSSTKKGLAREYGMSRTAIRFILSNEHWRHI